MQQSESTVDTEIAYERRGVGQSVVLLAGGMAPRPYWTPVRPQLEGYETVVPQRPGFGTCRDDPAETTADDVLAREVEFVRALVDALNDDRHDHTDPVLFGHSFGALVALESARRRATTAVETPGR